MDIVDEDWADSHYIDTPTGAIPFPMVEEMTQANIDKIKQPPAPKAAPGAGSTSTTPGAEVATNPSKQTAAIKKSLSEVITLVKAHHPEAKEAAEKLETKLTKKLKSLQAEVEKKIKEKA